MSKYEVLYVISPDLNDEEKQAVVDKFKKYVEDNGGAVAGIEKLGMKTLSYPIKFKKEGFFVLMNYELSKQSSTAMGKLMLINEAILRHMIVNKN